MSRTFAQRGARTLSSRQDIRQEEPTTAPAGSGPRGNIVDLSSLSNQQQPARPSVPPGPSGRGGRGGRGSSLPSSGSRGGRGNAAAGPTRGRGSAAAPREGRIRGGASSSSSGAGHRLGGQPLRRRDASEQRLRLLESHGLKSSPMEDEMIDEVEEELDYLEESFVHDLNVDVDVVDGDGEMEENYNELMSPSSYSVSSAASSSSATRPGTSYSIEEFEEEEQEEEKEEEKEKELTLLIRLPDSSRHQRVFSSSTLISTVFTWALELAKSRKCPGHLFQLARDYPRFALAGASCTTPGSDSKTLSSVGIENRECLLLLAIQPPNAILGAGRASKR